MTIPRVATPRDLKRKYWRNYHNAAWYGLGWRIYDFAGRKAIYHGGWVSGFRTDIALDSAAGLGLLILINAESNAIGGLTTQFLAAVFQWRRTFAAAATGDPLGDKSLGRRDTSPGPLSH